MKVILLDAGHGGMVNGEYATAGKRSPIWEDGSQYFEGVGNRLIRKEIIKLLEDEGIKYFEVNVGELDISLTARVKAANQLCKVYGAKNCLYIAIHSDAFSDPKAHGWSAYTSIGQTSSDTYAQWLYEEIIKEFPNETMRLDKTDGDADKEAKFTVLTDTHCPALLSENFFHTNKHECMDILMTEDGRKKIAAAHFRMIKRFVS